jgi:outer membrane protein TolC
MHGKEQRRRAWGLLGGALGWLALPARAEELTLARAMEAARSRALTVAAAEARGEAAAARLDEARAQRLPTLSLQEVGISTDSPAEAFALTLNQERFSFSDFAAADPNDPRRVESFTTRLELALPLTTGGEIPARIRQAERGLEAARSGSRWAADRAALAAATAYVRLGQAREQVALLERSLATVEAHVALARAYSEEGLLVRSELLRSEVERARVADFLAEARGQARIAESHLSFTLGMPLDHAWELAPLAAPAPLAVEVEAYLATAGERADLSAARAAAAASREEVAARKAGRRPRVALVARGDLADDVPFGAHGESATVMAVASIELLSGGRRAAAVAAAQAEASASQADVERFADGVALAVRQAFEAARTSRERHTTALASLAAAREALRITRERFAQGVVKTLDLLDAETALREAETRELVARAEGRLAVLQLAVEAGRAPESALAEEEVSP